MNRIVPFLILWLMRLLRLTCRVRILNDRRDQLHRNGHNFIYAVLHGQHCAMLVCGEAGVAALLSRSRDGDLLDRAFRDVGVIPIRGSAGPRRKGGVTAFRALVQHMAGGGQVALAVDGPKGPRGKVHAGVARLASKTGAAVIPANLTARPSLILKRTWDRAEIPLPFSRITCRFADPMFIREGESTAEFAARIEAALERLESHPERIAPTDESGIAPRQAA